MLGHSPFYHGTIRKAVVCFGRLFDNISILRTDSNGVEQKRIKIPLSYGPKERYLVRQESDPTLNKPVAITLPRISFQITQFNYAGDRKLASKIRNKSLGGTNDVQKTQYNSVPYDVDFELNIMTRNAEDGSRILEQILPFFTPEFTVTVHMIPELGLNDDVPVILKSVNLNDEYASDFMSQRAFIWTLQFTMKIALYGPIVDEKVITKASVDTGIPKGDITAESMAKTPRISRDTVTPDPVDALPTDDYGFDEVTETFDDGKKYDPETGTDIDIP